MYILILYYPLINAIICGFFGHKIGKYGAAISTLILMICCVLNSIFVYGEIVLFNSRVLIDLTKWIHVFGIDFKWQLIYDPLGVQMILLISFVSFCVHLYSLEYMGNDPHLPRFLSYLSFFTFCMLLLVTSSNLLLLLVGWEGIGLASYLLINFWYTRIAANKAAMKAMIINKIGDVSILLGIILWVCFFKSTDIAIINNIAWLIVGKSIYLNNLLFLININYITVILFLFIIGVCAKSAQIGLHTWLPDAMEGPTPVSALIHAATMVTAGVFLLLRLVSLLKYDNNSLLLISFLGAITSFIAATIGLFQNDIKKIIAYSTCSQLGYMVLSCGLNNYSGGLFHLVNHGFFKALLFLSAGAIIHSMLDQQDIRRMGMLLKYLPISYLMILIGSLTIMGIPFLTGFYSKDFLLECVYSSNIFLTFFLYWLGIISAALTSFYSIKLLFLTFYNIHNSYFNILYNSNKKMILIQESGYFIIVALIILFLGSVFIGYIFKDLFIGMGTDIWINTLDIESYKNSLKMFEVEFLPIEIKLMPIIFTFIAGLLSFIFFKFYIFILSFIHFIFNEIKFFFYFVRFIYNIFIIDLIKTRFINIEKFECNTKMAYLLNDYHDEKIIEDDFMKKKKDEKRYIEHIKNWIYYSSNNNNKYFFKNFINNEKNALAPIFRLKEFMYPFSYIKNLIFNGYYFNEIYNYYLYRNKKLSFNLMKNLDRGLIEYIGHLFIVNVINKILFFFSKKYPGRIDHFVFVIIVGIILINILLILWYILVEYKIFCLMLMLIFIRTLHKRNNWKPIKEFAIWLLVVFYNETDIEQYYVKKED